MLELLNHEVRIAPRNAIPNPGERRDKILGHPKSGKTLELVKRAFHTAHQGHKTLLLSQNPVETSALQEKAWIEQQKHHRNTPHKFPLTILYSHNLLDEIVKRLFPRLGYFDRPLWIHTNNTQSLSTQQAHQKNQISVPLAVYMLTRPEGPIRQHYEDAGLQYRFIYCDDSTLQPGYIEDLLPRLLAPQGTLTQVFLKSDPQQIYLLRGDTTSCKKHSLSIQQHSLTQPANGKKNIPDPLIGRWVLAALKRILLNQYEFSYGASKIKPLDIAVAFPLGNKTNHHFDLNHPWLETKRWRRYLSEHQERLSMPTNHLATIEIAPVGFHPAAGSSILTRQLRTPGKKIPGNRLSAQRAQIFCQPYFNLYGHFYDWMLLPYFENVFLPKTQHRQFHYIWFLASRARHTLCYAPSPASIPDWLADPRHPTRRALEKSTKIDIKT